MLLRAAIGIVALTEGGFYLGGKTQTPADAWIGAAIGMAAGGALLIGLLTPVAGVVAGLSAVGIGLSLLPAPIPNLLEARVSLLLTGIMTLAVIFLGPGRYSVDARLFGRREIIIPPSSHHSGQ